MDSLSTTSEKLSAAEAERTALSAQLEETQSEAKDLKAKLTRTMDSLSTTSEKLFALESTQVDLKPQLDEAMADVASLRLELGRVRGQLSAANERAAVLEGEKASLVPQVEAAQEEAVLAKAELRRIKSTLADSVERRAALEQSVAELKQQNEKLSRPTTDVLLKGEIARLNNNIARYRDRETEYQKKQEALETALAVAKERMSGLDNMLFTLRQHVAKVQDELQ